MTLTNTVANDILNEWFSSADTWLSLHSASPIAGGLAAAELTVVSYHRQPVLWSPPSNRTVTNDRDLTFSGLPIASVPFLGVYDALSGGNLLAELPVDPAYKPAQNGSALYIPAHTLVIELL